MRGIAGVPVLSPLHLPSRPESWFRRVAGNLQGLGARKTVAATPSTAGPLHFYSINLSARTGNAQAWSAVFHVLLFCLALTFLTATPGGKHLLRQIDIGTSRALLPYFRLPDTSCHGTTRVGPRGRRGRERPEAGAPREFGAGVVHAACAAASRRESRLAIARPSRGIRSECPHKRSDRDEFRLALDGLRYTFRWPGLPPRIRFGQEWRYGRWRWRWRRRRRRWRSLRQRRFTSYVQLLP